MYCGDETGSFVGEIGTRQSRFGYGGQDSPSLVTPSFVTADGRCVPQCCYSARDNLQTPLRCNTESSIDPANYLAQGDCVENWDAWEAMWQYSFDVLRTKDTFKHRSSSFSQRQQSDAKPASTTIGTTPSTTNDSKVTHPILVVSPGYTHTIGSNADRKREQRQLVELTERMMEKLDCGALFVAPTPMLAAFSHGRQTCTVVDIGASGSRVTPVVDGLLLYNSQRRNGRGGDWLGDIQWYALSQERTIVRARYQLRNPNAPTNAIFQRWAVQDLMYEMRTSGCMSLPSKKEPCIPFMDEDVAMDDVDEGEPNHYELPDGTLVDLSTKVGRNICKLPELLFSDSTPFLDEVSRSTVYSQHATLSVSPLHKLVHESLSAVADIDVRRELASQIILTGSVSLTPDLDKRLSHELAKLFKSRVILNKHAIERQCAAWIGGSILTSLGSFQQLWLSKAEYDEYGAFLACQRFPV